MGFKFIQRPIASLCTAADTWRRGPALPPGGLAAVTITLLACVLGLYLDTGIKTGAVTARVAAVEERVQARGTLEVVEQAVVTAPRAGRILSAPVRVGGRVEKGQVLARLDTRELESRLADARSRLNSARARLQASSRYTETGEIDILKQVVARMRDAYSGALDEEREVAALFEAGAATQRDRELVQRQSAAAWENLNLAETRLQLTEFEATPENLEALRAEMAEAETSAKTIQGQIDRSTLVSPIDGTLLELPAGPESAVMEGTPLAVVGDLSTLKVTAAVNERDASYLREGQPVKITGVSFPGVELTGRLSTIYPAALAAAFLPGVVPAGNSALVPVEVAVLEDSPPARPGCTAELEIATGPGKTALAVPVECLREENGKTFVFTVFNRTARMREIRTGVRGGGLVEVIEGLRPGEPVLVSPPSGLKDGDLVSPRFGG